MAKRHGRRDGRLARVNDLVRLVGQCADVEEVDEPVALEVVCARLLGLPEVASAEATGPRSVTAFAREGAAALPAVGALAAREGWKLHEQRPEGHRGR